MIQALRKRWFPATQDAAGFSLIEVLIALTIFSIGILGIAAMQITSMGSNTDARRVTDASTLAVDRLERLMATDYDSIASGNTTQSAYTVNWVVAEVDSDGNGTNDSKNITVTVNWSDMGAARDVVIENIIAEQ